MYKALWSTRDARHRERQHLRPGRGHRPGRRRRRGRDQLLRSAARRPTSATRSRSRSSTPPTRACSWPPRPATAARPPPPWRTRARGSPPWRPARTTATAEGSVDPRQRRHVHRGLGGRRGVAAPLIDSTAAGLPGADPTMVALCYAACDNGGVPVLDPAKVAGKIVVCDRGVTARVDKSLAVTEAGGVGMILLNPSTNIAQRGLPLRADRPPAEHRPRRGQGLRRHAGRHARPSARPRSCCTAPAPFTASFSSRGPLLAERRPAQARSHRPGPGHPGGGGAA